MIIRDAFLNNWRNKLVALVFAVSIWYVAYQSETQQFHTTFDIELVPRDDSASVITGIFQGGPAASGPRVSFGGAVQVLLSGPRKEIEILRDRVGRDRKRFSYSVSPGQEWHEFVEDDFGFPRDGVSIIRMTPAAVEILQEPVRELDVRDLAARVRVQPPLAAGKTLSTELLELESVRLRVPASLEPDVDLRLVVSRPTPGGWVETSARVVVESKAANVAIRAVQAWDWRQSRWGPVGELPDVRIRVAVEEKDETFQRDAVPVSFQVRALAKPIRIVLHDVTGDTIPLRFRGPSDSIARLQKAFEEDPGVGVTVPLPFFDPTTGGTFTFSEDDLSLQGFPEVRILRHDQRKEQLRSAWSYEVQVFAPPEDGMGGSG